MASLTATQRAMFMVMMLLLAVLLAYITLWDGGAAELVSARKAMR